jgi:hypothetical protein
MNLDLPDEWSEWMAALRTDASVLFRTFWISATSFLATWVLASAYWRLFA